MKNHPVLLVAALAMLVATPALLRGDLVIIDSPVAFTAPLPPLGGVFGNDPNSSPGQVAPILNMGNAGQPDSQSGSITAGELWTAFNNQGISSISFLNLSFALNETGPIGTNSVDVEDLRLRIEDPNSSSNITDVDLDEFMDNTIRVFNYAQGANTGEAQMIYNLGYDFMTTFNAGSTDLITVDATVTNRSDGFDLFFFDTSGVVIPEPGSLLVLSACGLGLFVRRRRD